MSFQRGLESPQHGRRHDAYSEFRRHSRSPNSRFSSNVPWMRRNDVKAELKAAKKEVKELKRKMSSAISENDEKNDILNKIVAHLEAQLASAKDNLSHENSLNADLKRKLEETSSQGDKKCGILNETIKKLETEIKKLEFQKQSSENEIRELKLIVAKTNEDNKDLKEQIRTSHNTFNNKWENAKRKFEELQKIHRMNDSLMKNIHSSFSSDAQMENKSSDNNGQSSTNRTTIETNDFPCNKCTKTYKQKGSLYRHIKEKHTEDLQKEFRIETSLSKRCKRLYTTM